MEAQGLKTEDVHQQYNESRIMHACLHHKKANSKIHGVNYVKEFA